MRKWFTIPPLLQLVITIGFIGFILIQASMSSSHLILIELHQQMQKQVSRELSQHLESTMILNQMHHDHLHCGMLNLKSTAVREQYFTNHLKLYPDLAMTFVGQPDGSFYGARRTADGELQVVRNDSTTNGASWYYRTDSLGEGIELMEQFPDFDARTRPWYIKAVEMGKPTFSNVYSHFIFHEPTITATHPVYDQNHQLIGVFGANYLMSWLGETLRSLPIGDSGQVFVTDDSGMLIASTLDTQAYTMVNGSSQLIAAKKIDNALVQSSISLADYEYGNELPKISVSGKNYYVGLSKYQEHGLDWSIYFAMAEDDFFGRVNSAISQTAIIVVCSLLLSILFTTLISGRMVKPITDLSSAAEELANGKLISIADDGRKDEIGKLTRSFNKMGLQLTQMVTHLELEVALRTQELEKSNEELKQLSFTDGLTGIPNRRQFDATLQSAWNTALRYNRSIGLFMIDIDLFKDYNDSYGHQAGDDSLKAIGQFMRDKVRRSTDLVARFGGEEFVVLIQDAEPDKLIEFAEEIRSGIERLNIEHANTPFQKITISIGVAHTVPSFDITPETLIRMADQALYQAKANGRNTVVVSKDSA